MWSISLIRLVMMLLALKLVISVGKNMRTLIISIGFIASISVSMLFGYVIGEKKTEENWLAISAIGDAAKLSFDLSLRKIMLESRYEDVLTALNKRIYSNISILNSYDDINEYIDGDKLLPKLEALSEQFKKEGKDVGGIEMLISKIKPSKI